jgi:molecular chaperone DnaK (HSP70)
VTAPDSRAPLNVGIDLGTTNSALAWINPAEAEDTSFPPIHIFDIPQLVAPNRIEPQRTLPSFLFLDEGQPVGAYARDQGAIVPTRLVHSAKSWLSNSDVDRTAKILPWDAGEGGRVLSPVDVSARFLKVMREAWDQTGFGPLAEQNLVLTVPASFDEEARELTVKAANEAGLERLTLLEEPAAAFYSWIANNLARSRKLLFDGQMVLICDVGGGTSDFSLIRVSRDGDRIDFTRTAVGKHLLLGGDNLDLTLAWLAESKLGKQLSIRQRSALRRQCSAAKEILLCDPRRESVEITVAGGGSSLIGGALKTEITRAEALELTLDGFLPLSKRGDKPKEEKRSLFRELGLPYVSDPAISRHLSAFLESSGLEQGPDAILFNGGFFIPEICRERVADVLENWYGRRPEIFENRDLDLAVASGAAYYSYVRSTGAGVLVRGGLPRAYYIGLADSTAVCLVPRGAEEGDSVEVDREDLQLVANRPVAFRMFSSLARTSDVPGQVVTFGPEEEIHQHAPLEAVIRFGKGGERLVPVKLGARLTETGTLETWCDSKVSENRWRLQFQLRKAPAASGVTASKPAAVVSQEAVDAAAELVRGAFTSGAVSPEELPARLEAALGLGRSSWPVDVARRLADVFLEQMENRKRSAALEVRWLNLGGFCLRPGFGYIGDDFRIEQVRRIYSAGPQFANQVQNETDWWIFWGRVAGGLNRNQQSDMVQRLLPVLLPKPGKKPQRMNSSLLREMWRTASSMELIPAGNRIQLGDALLKQGKESGFDATTLWCLSRLGARQLFYGPINQVLASSVATRWIEALINVAQAEDTLVSLARRTGDPVRDVSATTLAAVRARLKDERLIAQLEGDAERDDRTMGRIFGEDLPSGLVLIGAAT